jgi:hypothetical protein
MPSLEDIIKNGFTGEIQDFKIYRPNEVLLKTPRSERADVLSQIYPFYALSTKKENWKRYVKWLKANKKKHSRDQVLVFKKDKMFLRTRNDKAFAIMLAHIPTRDLYFVLSIAKDKDNRGENFSGWLMGEIFKKQ